MYLMHPVRHAFRYVLLAIPVGTAPLNASAQRAAYTGPSPAISIDGGPFELVSRWSGGDPRGKPVAGTTPLQVSGFAYAPIVIDVAIGPPRAGGGDKIVPWVTDFLAARDGAHTVDLVTADIAGKATAASIHATGVHLTEVRTPALDAAGKTPFLLTLVMAPQQTQPFAAGTAIANTLEMGNTTVSHFAFKLSGTSQQRTARIEPIVFTRSGGPVAVSNVVEDEAFVSAADVLAWRDDFVVQGHNTAANRRSAVLDLQSSTGTPIIALQLTGVGILSAATSPQAAGTEAIVTAHVELFAGGVTVATPGTTTTSTGVAPGTTQLGAADQGARDPAGVPRLAGLTRTSYNASRDKTSATEIGTYSTAASVDDTAAAYESAIKAAGWDESSRSEQGDTGKRTHLIILVFRKPQSTLTINVADVSPTGTSVRVLLATLP